MRTPARALLPLLLCLCSQVARAGDLRYYGVLFGPGPGALGAIQPNGNPLQILNFLGWSESFDRDTRFGVTFTWNWRPVLGQDLTLRDPFVRVSKPRAWSQGSWNWYTDLRLHLPITVASKNRDLWGALQSFNSLDWEPGWGGVGIFGSIRHNFLGSQGQGDEWELYLAPNLHVQLVQSLSLGLLMEWSGGSPFESLPGAEGRILFSDGWNLQPGLSWDATRNLNLSPFANIPLSSELEREITLGATLSWKIGV